MIGIFLAEGANVMHIRTGHLQLPGKATDWSAGRNPRLLQNALFQGGLNKAGWRLKQSRGPWPPASLEAGGERQPGPF